MKKQSKDQQGNEVKAMEGFWESLVDTAQVLIVVLDTEGQIAFFNRACQETTGYSPEEVLGRNWFDLSLPKWVREGAGEVFQKLLEGQLPSHYEKPILTKDGQERLIEWDNTFLRDEEGKVNYVVGTGRDITEHKRTEEALRGSEERLKILFEFAPDAYYLNDLRGTFIDGNKAAEEMTGYKREELIGKSFLKLNLLSPGQIPRAAMLLAKNARGQPTGPDEFILNRRDSSRIAVEIRTFPIKSEGQTLVLGIARDITERKRAEEALRQREESLRTLFETMAEGVVWIAPDGQIVQANPAAERILGLKRSEIEGRNYVGPEWEILRTDGTPMPPGEMAGPRAMKEKRPVKDVVMGFKHPDGSVSRINVSATPLINEAGELEGVVGTFADITERKQAEEALARHNRELEALSEVSRVVSSTLDLDTVLQLILEQLVRVIPYDSIALWLRSADTLYVAAARGFPNMEEILKLSVKVEDNSLFQAIEREKSPLIIADTHQDSRFLALGKTNYVRSWIGVPLMVKDRVIGTITIDKWEPHFYHGGHAQMAVTFANQAAIAIQNARLYQAERKRAAQLAVVNRVARQTASILDPDQLLQEIVTAIQQGFNYYNVALSLLDEAASELELLAIFGGFAELVSPGHRQAVGIGIVGWVAETGQPLLANDVSQEPRYISGSLEVVFTRSELCVPLKLAGRVIGVLDVQDTELNAFDETDLLAMETLADQMAVAIENARLFGETKRRFEETTALYQTSLDITAQLDMSELLKSIVERAVTLLQAEAGGIYLHELEREELRLAIGYDYTEEYVGTTLKPGEGMAGKVFQTGEPLIVDDYRAWEGRAPVYETDQPFSAVLEVPLKWRERIVGVLAIDADAQKRTFNQEDVWLATLFANQAAVAIENAHLFGEARRRAEELHLLFEATRDVSTSLELDEVLERAAAHLCWAAEATSGDIMVLDESGERATVRAQYWSPEASLLERTPDIGTTYDLTPHPAILQALQENRPLVTHADDPSLEPATHDMMADFDGRSALRIPMHVTGVLRGYALTWDSRQRHEWTDEQVRLCQTLANQAAVAIENARIYEEERKRVTQLELIGGITKRIASILDLDELLSQVAHLIGDTFGYYYTSILLVKADSDELILRTVTGPFDETLIGLRLKIGQEGITGWVAHSGEPLLVNDVSREPRYYFVQESKDTRSELAVPIKLRGEIIGVLDVQSVELDAFSQDDVSILQTLADQLAIAIENARLYEQAQARSRYLETLQQINATLRSTLPLSQVLETIAQGASQAFNYVGSLILMPDATGERLTLGTVWGGRFLDAAAKLTGLDVVSFSLPLAVKENPMAMAYLSGELQVWSGAPEWIVTGVEPVISPKLAPVIARTMGARGAACLPLSVGEKVVGVLVVFSPREYLSDEEQAILLGLADQAGLAIENARLYEETQQRAGEMAALYDTALDVAAQLDTRQVLQTIVERATDLLNGMGGAMYLYRSEQDDLELVLTHKLEPDFTGTVLRRGEGLSGKVLESGESTIVDCYREWSGRSPLYEGAPFEALIAVPVRWGEQILGVINVLREREAEAFDDQDVRLLTLFANQAAVAIENARLYAAEAQGRQEAETLRETALTLTTSLDRSQVIERILIQLQQVVPYDTASVQLLRGDHLEIVGGHGFPNLQGVLGVSFSVDGDNPNSEVVRTRAPLILENALAVYETFRRIPRARHIRSWVGVPMLVGERLVGIIALDKREPAFYTEEHARLAQAFAAQAAVAIENARLYEAEAQRRQEAETLRQAAMALTSTLNLEEALDRILEQLHHVVAYDSASVQLLRDDHLEIVSGRGFADPSAIIGLRFPVPAGNPNTRVIESGEPVILADAQAAHAPFREPPHDHIRSWLGVPVRFRERTIGLITLDSTELGHFAADHARLAAAFASQAAIALENARLFMATHRQAEQLETLRQVTQDLIALRDLDTLLYQIIERAMQLLDGEAGGLYLYRPEREVLEWAVAIGENVSPIGTTLSRGEGLSGKVWVTGKPLIVDDYGRWVGRSPKWPDLLASVVGVPIQWGDEFLGVLNIRAQSGRDCFTSGDAELLSQFAAQAAIAIENARLYQQVIDLAENLEVRVQERTTELAHRAQELSSLFQSSVALSSSLEVEEVLKALAQQAVLAVDAVDCTICERQDDALVVVASYRGPALPWEDPEIGRRYLLADYPATREAIEKWQPVRVRVDDPLADEVERAELQEWGYTALLQVPIVSQGQVVGIVEVFDDKPEREFSEGDAALLQTIANQAGMAIERARLFQQVREERNHLELLYEVSRKLSTSLDLGQTMRDIFETSMAATGASRGSVFVFDDEGRVAHRVLMRDLTPTEAEDAIDQVVRKGLAGWVLEHKQPAIVFDTSRDERWLPFPHDPEPVGSAMVIPFIERDRVRGLLTLVHPRSYHFKQTHLELLSSVAHQVAVVIERARLHEHARRRAVQLATAAEVSRDATSTLDVGQLLTRTVDLIRDRFDLYYAGIFLMDEAGEYAVLQAGTGKAGQQMLEQGHKLQVGSASTVGQCVANAQACIALDMGEEAIRFDNPLLPKTRTEMALPLISRGRVIGAMTIQSDRPAAFSDEDVTALQTLADQLANAIENARLYEETRRRAQEVAQQKEQTDAIVQSMADGLIVTDLGNRLVLANPAAEELLKFRLKDAIDREIEANIRDDRLRRIVRDTLDKQQAGYEVDIELTDPYDGAQRIIRAHTAGVNDPFGQPMGIVTTLRDVTHERELQRLKDELVSTVSHELRTPMTSVLGFSELLLTRKLSEEKRLLYTETIHREAQRLSALINDFLDIQRMERGQQEYHFEEVDLGELAREAVATYSGQSEAHTLTLDLSPDLPIVQADPDRLRQVFGNLLSNAIKFSPGGGTVVVSGQAVGDEIHVAVSDEGIGIPAEALPHIFERFFRVDSSDRREIQGAGLGLAICKGIVEAHLGRIWAESQEGVGTTVIFSLPMMTRKRILVIDDEKDIREMFQRLLGERSYEVLTAANGHEALSLMEEELPDLMILDIGMPVMNGYQFLEKVRGDGRTKDIPVIVISGVDSDIDRLKELRMDEFLSKPFSGTVLLETVQRLLKGS